MSSLAVIQKLSPQQMSDLLKADKKEDYFGFFDRVQACAKAGIQLTTIEVFLREHDCKTYLVAAEYKTSVVRLFPCRSPDGSEKPYFLHIAMHPRAPSNEERRENLKNLANTGFVLKMEK
jgi:hypothetical protein